MSDFDLIIRGGSVVRPDGVAQLDLGIKDGVITALGNAVFGSTDSDLDASDFHLFPGGVDPHVHFNEPGRTEWEGFEHGSRALAAGGVTSFFDMPLNAQPPVLDKGGFLAKWNFAKSSSILDFGLWGGLCDESLTHMQELTECGVIGFKAFMCNSGVEDFPMADDGTLLEGMRRAFDLEQIICVHAENEASPRASPAAPWPMVGSPRRTTSRPARPSRSWRPSSAQSSSPGKPSVHCTLPTSARGGGSNSSPEPRPKGSTSPARPARIT